ncbi:MAG: S9 family peptidase [Actinomycetota bacterium]
MTAAPKLPPADEHPEEPVSDARPSTTTATARRPIEPADLCRLRTVGTVQLHPSATDVVYTVTWPDAETDANRSVLYASSVDGSDRRQLTHGHRDGAPRFSPDGSQLAFLRSAPKQPTRVMVLSWPVGEITEVATLADGASELQWLGPDRLLVLAPQRPEDQRDVDDDELARRPRILTTIDYRFNGRGWIHDRPGQLLVVGLPGSAIPSEPTAIGLPGADHEAFAVSPDGTQVAAAVATDDDADLTGANHVWLYQVDGSEVPIRLTPQGGSWASLVWHPDGALVATGHLDNTRIGFHRPHLLALPPEAPAVTPLPDQDLHVVPSMLGGRGTAPVPGGVLYPGVRRGRIAIDRHDLDPTLPAAEARTVIHEGDHQVLAFDASADGSVIVAAVTSTTRPAELWRLDGDPTVLTDFNEAVLAGLDLAETTEVTVSSTDGAEVHAFVTVPPASAPPPAADGTRPALVYVHGGPMFQYGIGFFDEFQMAAACGYVVIGGNPRGSDGYGEAWADAITGDLGNRDWADVSALADHLRARDDVDDDRIGIGGGSYGGFMTGWALSHDPRFKAGLIERAVTSWNTMFGTSDIGTWFTAKTVGATIESDVDRVTRQSPLHHADRITAPTLIIHSEEDWRCPIEQAEQLFAAIRRNGGDVTLVRFPGENHELSRSGRLSHRIERFQIIHEFFATHLGGSDFGTDHL